MLFITHMLNESYKNRLKELAGLTNETVTLNATQGRSDQGTLSWYAEMYLLGLSSDIINTLDQAVQQENVINLAISKGASKMVSNSLVTKLIATSKTQQNEPEEYTFSLTVDFTKGASTAASITLKGVTNHLTLNSTHSADDIKTFTQNIVDYFLNSVKINQNK